jgi:GcrA cell cycle regulator
MSWTDERVELLRKLWLEGMSASRIASELGAGITRNAVIGKVHRLGVSGRSKGASNPAPRPPRAKPSPRPVPSRSQGPSVRGNTALAFAPELLAMPVARQAESVIVPIAERVTIMDLSEGMCRWPLGDPAQPEFRFCGSKAATGAAYCAGHRRLAYQPVQDRRRERDRERRQARPG